MRTSCVAWLSAISGFATYLRAVGRSKNTISLRTYYLHRLAVDTRSEDPWSLTIDQLIGWLGGPDWKPETRKAARASVCTFYRWAIDTHRMPPDLSPALNLPPIEVPRALPRPAPTSVLNQALAGASDRDRLMLLLAAYAGLRRAEIARTHPGRDVDRDANELVVAGKGGRVRRVPLHPDLLAAIDAELDRRRHGLVGTGWRYTARLDPDGYLFPGTKAPHMTPGHVGKVVGRLLAGDWTTHTLRHRFGSKAYAVERDLRAVQELLGHSKPETTARYVRVPADAMRVAVLAAGAA